MCLWVKLWSQFSIHNWIAGKRVNSFSARRFISDGVNVEKRNKLFISNVESRQLADMPHEGGGILPNCKAADAEYLDLLRYWKV